MIKITNSLTLIPISTNDQHKLENLMWHIYPHAYKHIWKHEDCTWYINEFYNQKRLDKDLKVPNSHYYFINYDTITIGIFRIQFQTKNQKYDRLTGIFIDKIYLGEEAQGKGIASQLFNWIESKAKVVGDTFIWLKVMDTQQQALKFYEKHGLKTIATTSYPSKQMIEPYRGMYVMSKLI